MEQHNKKEYNSIYQELLFKFLPYWPVFLGLIGLFLFGALYLAKNLPKQYITAASIIIRDERKGVETPSALESVNYYNSKQIVENENEVLRSKLLMTNVVDSNFLYAQISTRANFGNLSAYISSPVVIQVEEPENITAVTSGEFFYDKKSNSLILNSAVVTKNKWILFEGNKIRFLENPNYKNSGLTKFQFKLLPVAQVVEGLFEKLTISSANKLSTVINISLKDEVPARAEDIINSLIKEYNLDRIKLKKTLALNTLSFIDERLRGVENSLDSIEGNVQDYRSASSTIDLNEQGKAYIKNIGETDQKLTDLKMQLAVLDNLESYVKDKDKSSGQNLNVLSTNDKVLNNLVEKLLDAELKYENLKQTTDVNSPLRVSVQGEINRIKQSLLGNITNQRQSLEISIRDLTKSNSEYKTYLESIPKKERKLLEVNRDQEIKQSLYNYLLQKREETSMSLSLIMEDQNIIDKARSNFKPIFPNKVVFALFGILSGVLFSVLWVLLNENISSKVLFRSDLTKLTNLPVLAELSYFKKIEKKITDPVIKRMVFEQFNVLRQKLLRELRGDKNVVMITSSLAGEGKSFLSVNLAKGFARYGKRTCLVDFDLHIPKISRYFDLIEEPGISEYLQQQEELNNYVYSTEQSNLYVLPTGLLHAELAGQLNDADVSKIIRLLRSSFDYVIIDTPPVVQVSDAFTVSPFADITLFIVRHRKTPKRLCKKLQQYSDTKLLNNPVLVYNAVESRGVFQKWYGPGYGYGIEYEKTRPYV